MKPKLYTWTDARGAPCEVECEACGGFFDAVVEVGEERDYESRSARLCAACVREAVAAFDADTKPPVRWWCPACERDKSCPLCGALFSAGCEHVAIACQGCGTARLDAGAVKEKTCATSYPETLLERLNGIERDLEAAYQYAVDLEPPPRGSGEIAHAIADAGIAVCRARRMAAEKVSADRSRGEPVGAREKTS